MKKREGLKMVQLLNNGKSRKDIIYEYTLTPSTIEKYIKWPNAYHNIHN